MSLASSLNAFSLSGFLTEHLTGSYEKDQKELQYVFEIVRHGARSPSGGVDPLFPNTTAPGMLSPMGMRQHYLLGKYNNQTYMNKLNITGDELNI